MTPTKSEVAAAAEEMFDAVQDCGSQARMACLGDHVVIVASGGPASALRSMLLAKTPHGTARPGVRGSRPDPTAIRTRPEVRGT